MNVCGEALGCRAACGMGWQHGVLRALRQALRHVRLGCRILVKHRRWPQARGALAELASRVPIPHGTEGLVESCWLLLTSVVAVPLVCMVPGGSAVLGFLVRLPHMRCTAACESGDMRLRSHVAPILFPYHLQSKVRCCHACVSSHWRAVSAWSAAWQHSRPSLRSRWPPPVWLLALSLAPACS